MQVYNQRRNRKPVRTVSALIGVVGLTALWLPTEAQMRVQPGGSAPAIHSAPAPQVHYGGGSVGGGYHAYGPPAHFNYNNNYNSGAQYYRGAPTYGGSSRYYNVPEYRNYNPGQAYGRALPGTHYYGGGVNPGTNYNHVNNGYSNNNHNGYRDHSEGFSYRYHNGIYGRTYLHHYGVGLDIWFPGGFGYYPYYYPAYAYGLTCPSPYWAYYGAFPPYIGLNDVYSEPPQYSYVPYPEYNDGAYQGYRGDDVDGYYLNQNPPAGQYHYRVTEGVTGKDTPAIKDPALDAAIADIKSAWTGGDVESLSKHIRKDARVAVYLRGKYQYSLDPSDYLDITRDAIRATQTMKFDLDGVTRKQEGIYTVTGHHVYKDKEGAQHTVYVSYVLQKFDNDYDITQVGTAPEQLENPQ